MKLRNLRKLGAALVPFLVVLVASAQQPQDSVMKEAASRVSQALSGFKEDHVPWFVPEFFQTVPREQLVDALKKSGDGLGPVQRSRVIRTTGPYAAEVEFIGKAHRRLYAAVRLEPKPPHRIAYLYFSHLDTGHDTWDRLLLDVQKFPGMTGASVWRLSPKSQLLLTHQSDVPLAVGSSFKLLLLDTLADDIAAGKRKWSDIVTLRDEHRSLPSGMLHEWPTRSPLTLHTLASLMVARSDNTAADHLFHTLGRGAIEMQQRAAKIQAPERNLPFLSTSELFKLKLILPTERLQQYAEASEANKRKIIETLTQVRLQSPRTLTTPLLVDRVEWFFTTDDMCRLLDRFRLSKVQAELLPILTITRPYELDTYEWDYLGFKGGAEAGVLNLSVLGRRKGAGDWFAFAFTWNRTDEVLDEPSWLRQLDRAIHLAERESK
jgi:beta-lactamase class A